MDNDTLTLSVELSSEVLTKTQLAQATNQFIGAVNKIGVDSVEKVADKTDTTGAMGGEPILIGALLVSLAPHLLDSLLTVTRSWLVRRPDQNIKIKITSGKKSIEIEVPASMKPAELDAWIRYCKETLK